MASTTVTYTKKGTNPPVFLAGSFSGWKPEEMEYEIAEGQELKFYKTIEAEEGKEFQYKFKIGEGDWWVLDEEAPVVTDNIGNRNNLLVIPRKPPPTMSDQAVEAPGKQSLMMEPIVLTPQKDLVKEDSQVNRTKPKDQTVTKVMEVSAKTGGVMTDSELAKQEEPVPHSTKTEDIPTLVVEKTDDSPSFGEDFGPNATVAEKDAHALRSVDTEPDQVLISPEEAGSTEAETIAEVSESAILLDKRALTPDISNDEAGETGFRRMSATPIPEVASTAAEVEESAALLDRDAPTPEVPDTEAGIIGLRRMSTTPIPEVAETAAEVADVAAVLDREESGTPDLTDEEAGQIGRRRMSMTPISQVAETAAEVAAIAASLDDEEHSAQHIKTPPSYAGFEDDDDDKEYPITPEDEKAPLFPHEKFIPSKTESPASPNPEIESESPAITPWDERAPLFSHERYIEPGSNNSPQRQDSIPSPEAEHSNPMNYDIQDFPTTREGIMQLISQTQLDLPEDEIRLRSPTSPSVSPSQLYDRPDLPTPGASPRRERNSSSLQGLTSVSLTSIVEENDSFVGEDDATTEVTKENGDLTATKLGDGDEHTGNQEVAESNPEETPEALQSDVRQEKQEPAEKHDLLATEQEPDSVRTATEAPAVFEVFVPMNSSEPELDKTPAEFLDSVLKAGENVDEDGNLKSEHSRAAGSVFESFEVGDDAVSNDTPKMTPPTSNEGEPVSDHEHQDAVVAALGLESPAIIVQPATPAATTRADPMSTQSIGEVIEEEVPESTTAPMPVEIKTHTHTQQTDTITTTTLSQNPQPVLAPAPVETKTHVHTQERDTTITNTVSHDTTDTFSDDPDATTLVTENTVTRRRPGKPSSVRSESSASKDHSSPAHDDQEEHRGLLQVFCTAVMGWIGGFFAKLCGGEREKGTKKKAGGGNVKRVIGATAAVLLIAVVVHVTWVKWV